MPRENVKHRGPQQKRVVDGDVILLRKINPRKMGGLMQELRFTQLAPNEPEGDMPWFLENYVACDHPRSVEMSKALLDATVGYAVARVDNGEILVDLPGTVESYQRAAGIANSVKIENAINMVVQEQEEDADGDSSTR